MTDQSIASLNRIARGDAPADLLIRNARIVNVFVGEVIETDVAIAGGRIVGFGPYEALISLDLKGRYLAPGFIDAHVHIESAMVAPVQFARVVASHGTTAVVADPHEVANVLGTAGIDYMLKASEVVPIHFYFTLPSCVPATNMETSGAHLNADAIKPYIDHPRIVALAEMMNFPGVIYADADVMAKIDAVKKAGKPLDGHSPGLTGRALSAYLLPGIGSDHECTTATEASEKLVAGMHIMVREGTGAQNLDSLLPVITPRTARRMMWCTDDRHPQDLLAQGHIDSMVRRAVRSGLDPIIAVQMATLNPSEYFHLNEIGAIAPGRWADMVVLDDLRDIVVRQVYCRGRLMVEEGELVDDGFADIKTSAPNIMAIALERIDFRLPAQGRRIRVIETIPHQIVTRSSVADARIIDGCAETNLDSDLVKIAVVERYHGTGGMGIGFIRGLGLKRGALASSVAHDSHNVIVAGTNDADMLVAVTELDAMGGGLVVVEKASVLAKLPLPIAGLMSDQPMSVVNAGLETLLKAAHGLGCWINDPFMTLSFMALPVIPALKITDKGLVDVEKFELIPLFID